MLKIIQQNSYNEKLYKIKIGKLILIMEKIHSNKIRKNIKLNKI